MLNFKTAECIDFMIMDMQFILALRIWST